MYSVNQIRRQFIDFFVKHHKHMEIPSASLIPENDPTVLFTTAGMHPLVPYLMGEPHPNGFRLVNAQKCLRTDDIDEVGDATHLTYFEMLGNWSLGDYFKAGAIEMSIQLLTQAWEKGGYGLPVERLFITCFAGDKDAPRDAESAELWKKHGIPENRIYFYPKAKNWWGPAGQTGPCGPDTEMFYDQVGAADYTIHKVTPPPDLYPPIDHPGFQPGHCHPNCECGRYIEIWNDVFMQYNKLGEGKFESLKQKNVDTGLGFERLVAILHGKENHYETELFTPAILKIYELATGSEPAPGVAEGAFSSVGRAEWFQKTQQPEFVKATRIIADHLRAATFILGDRFGVTPSNVDRGYILRRLIRRATRYAQQIGIQPMRKISHTKWTPSFTTKIAEKYIDIYKKVYPELEKNRKRIVTELEEEERRFAKTLVKGLRELKKMVDRKEAGWRAYRGEAERRKEVSGQDAFYIFETYGFPVEMIREELAREGFTFSNEEFQKAYGEAFKKHQEVSRAGAEQKFAGGLADHSEQTKMHHTATHLVHQALRDVLGLHVFQKGSNVTRERLRFDFSHSTKMTPEQIKKTEEIVNEQIQHDLPVHFEILEVDEAKKQGAIGLFDDKYAQLGNKVKVYFMGDYSREVCGGPHVEHTGVLKKFKIVKEEACSAGIRRIKAVVEGIKDVI